MSKTFTYVLLVIGVYVAIITAKVISNKDDDSKSDTKSDSEKKDGKVAKGAEGQQKYRIGSVK